MDEALPGEIPVWDPIVRVVHWTLVLLLAVLVPTGLAGGEWLAWHMRTGEAMLALVLFRVAWGFAGSRNARFRAFVRGPRAVGRYARALRHRAHELHATHNPLGAWMVVALLTMLLLQCSLGLFTNDDLLYEGPLAKFVTKDVSDLLASLHRRGWWILLVLAGVHVGAVASYYVLLRDNLVRPMITGRKRLPADVAAPQSHAWSPARAAALFALSVALVVYIASR